MVEDGVGLREWALHAWRCKRTEEVPGPLELTARYLDAVRRKLLGMFGTDFEITAEARDDGKIVARVDDVSFSTFVYDEEMITVIPVVVCPACEREVFFGGVASLAELGKAFEDYERGLVHECQLQPG
jgi:hypothetical protein